ncbi:MAG: hypothetical protein ACJ8GL_05340 [Bacillus sp. (in: firmicutes)]
MKKLNEIPSKLTNRHKILADQLITMHQTNSPYEKRPPTVNEGGVYSNKSNALPYQVEGRILAKLHMDVIN